MTWTWLAIAIGGALGSVARHGLNSVVQTEARFPVGITLVNISGCFAIGLLAGLLAAERIALDKHWREFVFVGLLGGYTTFSTFGLDTFVLARGGAMRYAAANVIAQVIGGLGAVWVGYQLGVAK
jgi:fluoride exporter